VNEALRLPALEDENIRFNNLVADQAVQISILKEVNSKSGKPVVGTAAIENVLEQGKGATADTSRAFGPQRSTYYHNSTIIPERQKIERTIVGLSEDHPRYGYRRITVAMRGGVDQCKAGSKGAPPLWTAGSQDAAKAAADGAFHDAASACHPCQSRLEPGLCGRPD
jgi:hypothetical protein